MRAVRPLYEEIKAAEEGGHPGLFEWLLDGQRGVSSESIVHHLTGFRNPGGYSIPVDGGDFRRCELLLIAVPSLRPLMPRMAELGGQWVNVANRWEEIRAVFEVEATTARLWETTRLLRECMSDTAKATR